MAIPMHGSEENLKTHAARPLAQWLIHAARRRTLMTYAEAKHRLETETAVCLLKPLGFFFLPHSVLHVMNSRLVQCPSDLAGQVSDQTLR